MKLVYAFEAEYLKDVADEAQRVAVRLRHEADQATRELEEVRRELAIADAVVALRNAEVLLARHGDARAAPWVSHARHSDL